MTHGVAVDPYDMDSDSDHNQSSSRRLSQDDLEDEEDSKLDQEDLLQQRHRSSSLLEDSCDFGDKEQHHNDIVMDEDDDTKEESSLALNSEFASCNSEIHSPNSHISSKSRNKRKNFKPRNIIYESEQQPTIQPKVLMKPDGPMDLSKNGSMILEDNSDEESESDNGRSMDQANHGGLSVVRPEVLFGMHQNQGPPGLKDFMNPLANSNNGPAGIPPFLAPFLAASSAAGNPAGPSVKDAFQEVLKMFGIPPELAEVLAKNAQAFQQQQQQQFKQDHPATTSSQGLLQAPNPGQDQGKGPFIVSFML